jgi:cellobiose-specific phosphotransferase system component IIC
VIGIVLSEIYKFFTWHVLTITGEISLRSSIRLAFPEFYFGLIVSMIMVLIYFLIDENVAKEQSLVDCVKEV